MQQDQDKSQGEYIVEKGGRKKNTLLWKTQIQTTILLKNLLNFLSLLSERILLQNPSYFFTLESELQSIQNSSYRRRERDALCCCVFKIKERNAIYSALERAEV